jgi:8-oxo-dGTP diphosphatase
MASNKFKRRIPAGAIIFNDKDEVLMSQRFEEGERWHGKWNLPGGGIEFGEDPKETAIRETREEVGVEIKILSDFPIVMNYLNKDKNEDYVCIAYVANYLSGELDVSKDDGTSDVKWFKYKDIDFDNCLPFTKEILDIAKKRLINLQIQKDK